MTATRGGGDRDCVLEYDAGVIDAGTANRMATHFVGMLEEIGGHVQTTVGELRMLTLEEQRLLLVDLASGGEVSGSRSAHEQFEEYAGANPLAPATEFDGRVLSYAELNE